MYVPKIIKECLDLDEWKYSWHNKFESIEDLNNAIDVINEKIDSRIAELALLRDAKKELKCLIKDYITTEGEPLKNSTRGPGW